MVELLMKQKALSIRENYEVYSSDELKYIIQRRKLLAKKPVFDIFVEEGVVATAEVTSTAAPVIYKIAFNGEDAGEVRYDETPGVNKLVYEAKGIEVDGNSILSEFTIKDKDKKIIGTIKKKLVSMKDTYDIKFENDDDELLIVMLALLVDETFHG